MFMEGTKIKSRSDPGIEPGTSCTQSRNHASRPIGQLLVFDVENGLPGLS